MNNPKSIRASDLPEAFSGAVISVLSDALEDFYSGEMPEPCFYVGNIAQARFVVVPILTQNKNLTAQVVQLAAQEMDADIVVNVFEAWVVVQTPDKTENKITSLEGSLSEHPDRKTVLFCSVETYEHQYMAQIPEGSGIHPEDVEFIESNIEGRFSRMLPNHPKRTVH